jgi:uncharacterized protein with FMN-binding domain
MPKRPFFAVLLSGTALALVLSFKTPEVAPATLAENLPVVVGGQGESSPAAVAVSSGSFTGSTIRTPFGPVQVEVTVQSGKITAVQALQAPSGDPHSSQLSQYAVPQLVQAVLQAQSAKVNSISGATYTSLAFTQSLQSALAQAGM